MAHEEDWEQVGELCDAFGDPIEVDVRGATVRVTFELRGEQPIGMHFDAPQQDAFDRAWSDAVRMARRASLGEQLRRLFIGLDDPEPEVAGAFDIVANTLRILDDQARAQAEAADHG